MRVNGDHQCLNFVVGISQEIAQKKNLTLSESFHKFLHLFSQFYKTFYLYLQQKNLKLL